MNENGINNARDIARINLDLTQEELVRVKGLIPAMKRIRDGLAGMPIIDPQFPMMYGPLQEYLDNLEERHADLIALENYDRTELTEILTESHKSLHWYLQMLNYSLGDLGAGFVDSANQDISALKASIELELQEIGKIMEKYDISIEEQRGSI